MTHTISKKKRIMQLIRKFVFLEIGAIIAAAGLEFFLIPNQIIDGGVVGISIMVSFLATWPVGVFIAIFNAPFLLLCYKHIGKTFVFSTIFATLSLSFWTSVFHPIPGLTNDLFLAAMFGGLVVGLGVGLIIRNGGSLDGTEMVAIILDKRTGFSVGEIIMIMNLIIFTIAGFVFSWDKALYSLAAYFIAFKTIDIVIRGLDESKGVFIISDNDREIIEAVVHRLGRGVTILFGEGGVSGESKNVLYVVVTRLEVAKLKSLVSEIDPTAFLTVHEVHEVMYSKMRKKAIH